MSSQSTAVVFILAMIAFSVPSAVIGFIEDSLSLSALTSPQDGELKVGAFNVQTLGLTKVENATLLGYITRIINRYDIVFIQEVRDISGVALDKILSYLNSESDEKDWDLVYSTRLGRTSSKEQYVFFYQTNYVEIVSTFQLDDSANDVFEREPFAVEIKYQSDISNSASEKRAVLAGLHARPTDAFAELSALPEAIRTIDAHFKNVSGVILMGDLNADCRYLSNADIDSLEIFQSGGDFVSLLGHDEDTTVSSTDCAYDRVIVYGNDVIAKNVSVFDFQTSYGISYNLAMSISDHFPVEFSLL